MSLLQPFIDHPLVTLVVWTLVHSLWIGLIAALIAVIAMRSAPQLNSQTRYLILLVIFFSVPVSAMICISFKTVV